MTKLKDRYARVPARLWRDPELAGLSLGARGLFLWCWSYFADAMSDGVIPAAAVVQVAGAKHGKELAELLARDVWERVEGGYRCTWYLRGKANMTRAEWEEQKAGTKKRVAEHRATRDIERGNDSVTRYPQTQDTGRRTPDRAESASDARADESSGSPAFRESLLDGFGRRIESALGEGRWQRETASEKMILFVLGAVASATDVEGDLERGLDAYFAYCAEHRVRPEFGWTLARDFGKWLGRTSLPADGSSRSARLAQVQRLAEATSSAGDIP